MSRDTATTHHRADHLRDRAAHQHPPAIPPDAAEASQAPAGGPPGASSRHPQSRADHATSGPAAPFIPGPCDYQPFAATSLIISERLCEAVGLRAGWRVLDLATGTGNAALAAARRCCHVVGVDLIAGGLDRARLRARAEGLHARFLAADALCLPFPDGAFDAVVSTLGVIFAGDHQTAADELLRVCRPGGRVGLANWTPDGWTAAFLATLLELTSPHRPRNQGASPFRWGTEEGLKDLFGDRLARLSAHRRTFHARHHNPESFWAFIQATNPFVRARMEAADPATQRRVTRQVLALIDRFNRADDGTVVAAQDYLEVVAVRA